MEILALLTTLIAIFLLTKVAEPRTESDKYEKERWEMVEKQIVNRGIRDKMVIEAMLKVPRHKFVPEDLVDRAYDDGPLPIGMGQTISQPYIVALMTELLLPGPGKSILEIGTGSGYQSAVLAETGTDVYTVEIVEKLGLASKEKLLELGYKNINFMIGDGYSGWEEHSPYDGIILTAAPGTVPKPLVNQLKVGGRMVIPVGGSDQQLLLITKTDEGIEKKYVTSVRFVPMTGLSVGPGRTA